MLSVQTARAIALALSGLAAFGFFVAAVILLAGNHDTVLAGLLVLYGSVVPALFAIPFWARGNTWPKIGVIVGIAIAITYAAHASLILLYQTWATYHQEASQKALAAAFLKSKAFSYHNVRYDVNHSRLVRTGNGKFTGQAIETGTRVTAGTLRYRDKVYEVDDIGANFAEIQTGLDGGVSSYGRVNPSWLEVIAPRE
jgi:hypothetical protein